MILNILTDPNTILHQKSRPLSKEDILSKDIQNLIKQMIPTMYLKDGVGLAAPQVGELVQICIISREYNKDKTKDLVLINPVWKKASVLKEWSDEGCLSVPDVYGKVKRWKKIRLQALDRDSKEVNITVSGFLAKIIQHEVDHLHGIIFTEKAKDLHTVYKE